MSRSARLLAFAAVASVTALPAVAGAQMLQGPPMPLVVDLAKTPLGSWAKYDMSIGSLPPMSLKLALVDRNSKGNVVESQSTGGLAAKAGNVVTQMTLASGQDADVRQMVVQVGANDPMEKPLAPEQTHQFTKPNPKTFVKVETVKVPAGSYKAKHYHDSMGQGDTVDFWVSESVAPLGLIKVEMTQKGNPMISGPIKMELAGVGKGAKRLITKAPKPYDEAALIKEMSGGAAAPAPAGK
ncbi:MAG TPA: hypothetical protein VHO06_07350 [Polyangia bacterium]|nr:hypothetical protein [Polyangia bacterium]